MTNPRERGYWSTKYAKPWPPLQCGVKYRVIQAFTDYDGELHPVGEEWLYLGHDYNAYHDGLSLFISRDGDREWHLRLSALDNPPDVHRLEQYLEPLS